MVRLWQICKIRTLSIVHDLTFDRMKIVPYLRREMLQTLAGLKSGF
jgi:hypothetical protein